MNINAANRSYEIWLDKQTPLNKKDLQKKYKKMSDDPASFLRATFFRWVQIWPDICRDLVAAPGVLAIGDLHIENFGTWRDSEGRLVWGINDFDEAFTMPYVIDLVRLAASYRLAAPVSGKAWLKPGDACARIIDGYHDALKAGGRAFVLQAKNDWLRSLAEANLKNPTLFYNDFEQGLTRANQSNVPPAIAKILKATLPPGSKVTGFAARAAGKGSLGRQRFVVLADCDGGQIVREAKALADSGWLWANPVKRKSEIYYDQILRSAVRSPDPFLRVIDRWITRRLAGDCIKVELGKLKLVPVESDMLYAMGWETGNIHLGSGNAIKAIQNDLKKRPADWLRTASKLMAEATVRDWQDWKKTHKTTTPA